LTVCSINTTRNTDERALQSDLYAWREIFQIYLEAEVFEAVGERTRGERTVEESEKRLQQFAERVTQNGLGDKRKFKLKQSIEALETFLSLNLFILNVKKVGILFYSSSWDSRVSSSPMQILKRRGRY
jgi:hypothetical protein